MSSTEITFEEKKQIIQDNLISIITDSVSTQSSIVRFFKPDERTMSEREMQLLFNVYNGFVYITHHSKKSKKTEILVQVGKNFENYVLSLDLEANVISSLKGWIRSASKALETHFSTRYEGIYLGRLRFDFISKDRQTFIIPNFLLETNIFLYKDIASANSSHFTETPENSPNRIDFKEFVNSEWEDILLERQFRNR